MRTLQNKVSQWFEKVSFYNYFWRKNSNWNIHKQNIEKPSQFDELFLHFNLTLKIRQMATFIRKIKQNII